LISKKSSSLKLLGQMNQLAQQFQGRRFLEIDQSETRIACAVMFANESG
jgi:hypothetical protein